MAEVELCCGSETLGLIWAGPARTVAVPLFVWLQFCTVAIAAALAAPCAVIFSLLMLLLLLPKHTAHHIVSSIYFLHPCTHVDASYWWPTVA